jgi:hypothetical protein
MTTVFNWAKTNKLMKETDYPYIKKYSGYCNEVNSLGVIYTKGSVSVSGNVNALMTAVAQQPVSIGVEASNAVF